MHPAIIAYQHECESCSRAREIENARLAWRDLYNMRNPNRERMGFHQLAAYGAIHYDSRVKCFSCQSSQSVRNMPDAQ